MALSISIPKIPKVEVPSLKIGKPRLRAAEAPAGMPTIAQTKQHTWELAGLVTAVVAALIMIYIGYTIVQQIQSATNVTPPGASILTTVWTFLALMVFVGIAGGIIGYLMAVMGRR